MTQHDSAPTPAQVYETPVVAGEIDSSMRTEIQLEGQVEHHAQGARISGLGATALEQAGTTTPEVPMVHIVTTPGEEHFIVGSGPNKGDVIRADSDGRSRRFGLGTPAEESEKLKSRTDMNKQEWDYFATQADMLIAAGANRAKPEDITHMGVDLLNKLDASSVRQYYSPAMKTAMTMLSMGARRQPGDAQWLLDNTLSLGYLSEVEAADLRQLVHRVEDNRILPSDSPDYQHNVMTVAEQLAQTVPGVDTHEGYLAAASAYLLGVTADTPDVAMHLKANMQQRFSEAKE